MIWEKLGLLYNNKSDSKYLSSHFSNPLPVRLRDDIFRVYYSGRNNLNKSSVGHFDFDIKTLEIIGNSTDEVDFTFDNSDSFFSHGVSVGCTYYVNNVEYILFMGWNIPGNEHWRGEIGRIKLDDNYRFSIDPVKSLLGLDSEDPISLSYPFVLKDNNIYRMWYGSTVSWDSENGEMIHIIKNATSVDGINWVKNGTAVPYELGVAQAFSRPSVIFNDSGFHMWYSYRSGIANTKYQIGYSHSVDGFNWIRNHDVGVLKASISGWDSEMVCYPYVFIHNNRTYMLYNGNGFGETGIGLAVLI